MKKVALLSVLILFGLAGCSTPAPPASTPAESSEPSIDPGPVELSKEEAGERYLSLVCQGNFNVQNILSAFEAGEAEFLAGGSPSVEAVNAAAAESVRVKRMLIEAIDDTYYVWPEAVSEQLAHIRSSTMAEIATDQALMNASSFEDAYYTTYPTPTPEQGSAAQEIRYQLGLDADTTGSCTGYETRLDELHNEMTKRSEQLAAQEDGQ